VSTSRRDFLVGLGTGLLGLAAAMERRADAMQEGRAVIERIDLTPIRYPTIGRFKFFEGPPGTPVGRAAVVVRIEGSAGHVGWGQSVPIPKWSYETLETVASTIEVYLKPVLIGMDPFDLESIHAAMNANIANGFTTGQPICKAGIDSALHDLVCKASNIRLADLWGRSPGGPITMSWTLNPADLNETEGLIQQGWERGYRNFNVKVAPDPAYDVELCRIVRANVPDGFLWADANGGYDPATAMEAIPRLADAGVDVLEQPLPPNRITAYREIKKMSPIPILMDEGVISPDDLLEFIRLDMLDGMAMKPARVGGLLPARRQLEILEDAGLLFLGSGLTDPDLSLAASLALYGAFGLRFPAALNGPQFLDGSVLTEPLVPGSDGTIDVPSGPGLGVEVDEARLAAMAEESTR
jgi:L-alanine-DL-glutamate epimerase-like enolase superfamily enzyme